MDRLFLIDHSLRDTGGHHFDYVRSVAQAAQQSGVNVIVGCHRDLATKSCDADSDLSEALQRLGDVRAVFPETVYQGESWLAGLRRSKRKQPLFDAQLDAGSGRRGVGRWLHSFKDRLAERRRKRIVNCFSAGCRDFFQSLEPRYGDQVLVAAASELEVAGAVDFLRAHPQALNADWHFLFHFNLMDGWTSEYGAQRVAMMRTRSDLRQAIRSLPSNSLHFHATTETLADQFNCLQTATFTPLPYPISNDFLPEHNALCTKQSDMAPNLGCDGIPVSSISLVCAGATRREKGQAAQLQGLIDKIKEPLLLTGKARLLVQRPSQKRFGKPWLELYLDDGPAATSEPGSNSDSDTASSELVPSDVNPIEYVPHPLPRNDYRQLLRSADVGLFCYDARSYFSRCAGILVEMLACGKPVIVPAGTWLADQIQGPIHQHASRFQQRNVARVQFDHSDFKFDHENVPGPGGVWSFDEGAHPFIAAVDCDACDQTALIQFDWHWPRLHGLYARVECLQRDAGDRPISMTAQAIGISRKESSPGLLFPLQPECCRVEFRMTNAFGTGALTIRNFSTMLYSTDSIPGGCPVGAVGVIAASRHELPQCVTEVVTNIDHYRKTAEQFSHKWLRRHHPQRTIDRMFDLSESSARVA